MRSHREESAGWVQLRAFILRRDGNCRVCGTRFSLTAHHVKPRALGGEDSERNLIALCGRCHDYVDGHELDWPGILLLRSQGLFEMTGGLDLDNRVRVGKDRFGVFIIRDESPGGVIAYDGVWPVVVRNVEARPRRRAEASR